MPIICDTWWEGKKEVSLLQHSDCNFCIAGFTLFWAIIFIVSSTLIWIFKREESRDAANDSDECRLSLKESYKCSWQILKIAPVQELCIILLTFQVSKLFALKKP